MSKTATARIAWKSKLTGSTGHGEYMSPSLAQAWLEAAEAEWGHVISHWLEGSWGR